jgi:hypothetical protein
VTWCAKAGDTLLNNTTDKREIISHVLIPDEVIGLPDKEVLGIEWPAERLGQPEERITQGILNDPFFELRYVGIDKEGNKVQIERAP